MCTFAWQIVAHAIMHYSPLLYFSSNNREKDWGDWMELHRVWAGSFSATMIKSRYGRCNSHCLLYSHIPFPFQAWTSIPLGVIETMLPQTRKLSRHLSKMYPYCTLQSLLNRLVSLPHSVTSLWTVYSTCLFSAITGNVLEPKRGSIQKYRWWCYCKLHRAVIQRFTGIHWCLAHSSWTTAGR